MQQAPSQPELVHDPHSEQVHGPSLLPEQQVAGSGVTKSSGPGPPELDTDEVETLPLPEPLAAEHPETTLDLRLATRLA